MASTPNASTGVVLGPSDTLLYARLPGNELGQVRAGSQTTDKVVDLTPLGVAETSSGLGIVPLGFAGAGAFKLLSYSNGEWYTLSMAGDGTGTFDVTGASKETTIFGGAAGLAWIEAGNPGFPVDGMIVGEWDAGAASAYDIDGAGDPAPDTRRDLVTGLEGANAILRDSVSGDLVIATFEGNAEIFVIEGFDPPG